MRWGSGWNFRKISGCSVGDDLRKALSVDTAVVLLTEKTGLESILERLLGSSWWFEFLSVLLEEVMPFTNAKTRDGSSWIGGQTSRFCNSPKCDIYIYEVPKRRCLMRN